MPSISSAPSPIADFNRAGAKPARLGDTEMERLIDLRGEAAIGRQGHENFGGFQG